MAQALGDTLNQGVKGAKQLGKDVDGTKNVTLDAAGNDYTGTCRRGCNPRLQAPGAASSPARTLAATRPHRMRELVKLLLRERDEH